MFRVENMKRVYFEKKQIGMNYRMPSRMETIRGWNIEEAKDYASNDIMYHVHRLMVHGEKKVDGVARVPKSWWDHFKYQVIFPRREKFFFSFLYKKMKLIKYKDIKVNVTLNRFCPHYDTSNNQEHIEFLLYEPMGVYDGERLDCR